MKLKRVAMWSLTLGVLTAASAAYAQQSVTLYGELDDAVAYFNNAGHAPVTELQVGDYTGNQWGLTGTEDLGRGTRATFKILNGFNVNTGKAAQGGREFGKSSWVGLESDSLGSIRLGRQYDTTVDLVQPFTSDRYSPAFSTPGDADNNDETFRVQNSVKYISPDYDGLRAELMYGLGGVAGSISSQETSSAGVSFTDGGLGMAAAYVYAKNDDPAGTGTADQTQNNSVTPLFGSTPFVGSRMISQVAVQYATGPFTANVRYSNAQWKPDVELAAFNRTEIYNTEDASIAYQLSKSVLVDLGYDFTRSSGGSSASYKTIAAATQYSLSRQTTLYAISAYSHAHGTTFSSNGESIVPAGGTIGDVAPSSSTPNQVALMLGITHKF